MFPFTSSSSVVPFSPAVFAVQALTTGCKEHSSRFLALSSESPSAAIDAILSSLGGLCERVEEAMGAAGGVADAASTIRPFAISLYNATREVSHRSAEGGRTLLLLGARLLSCRLLGALSLAPGSPREWAWEASRCWTRVGVACLESRAWSEGAGAFSASRRCFAGRGGFASALRASEAGGGDDALSSAFESTVGEAACWWNIYLGLGDASSSSSSGGGGEMADGSNGASLAARSSDAGGALRSCVSALEQAVALLPLFASPSSGPPSSAQAASPPLSAEASRVQAMATTAAMALYHGGAWSAAVPFLRLVVDVGKTFLPASTSSTLTLGTFESPPSFEASYRDATLCLAHAIVESHISTLGEGGGASSSSSSVSSSSALGGGLSLPADSSSVAVEVESLLSSCRSAATTPIGLYILCRCSILRGSPRDRPSDIASALASAAASSPSSLPLLVVAVRAVAEFLQGPLGDLSPDVVKLYTLASLAAEGGAANDGGGADGGSDQGEGGSAGLALGDVESERQLRATTLTDLRLDLIVRAICSGGAPSASHHVTFSSGASAASASAAAAAAAAPSQLQGTASIMAPPPLHPIALPMLRRIVDDHVSGRLRLPLLSLPEGGGGGGGGGGATSGRGGASSSMTLLLGVVRNLCAASWSAGVWAGAVEWAEAERALLRTMLPPDGELIPRELSAQISYATSILAGAFLKLGDDRRWLAAALEAARLGPDGVAQESRSISAAALDDDGAAPTPASDDLLSEYTLRAIQALVSVADDGALASASAGGGSHDDAIGPFEEVEATAPPGPSDTHRRSGFISAAVAALLSRASPSSANDVAIVYRCAAFLFSKAKGDASARPSASGNASAGSSSASVAAAPSFGAVPPRSLVCTLCSAAGDCALFVVDALVGSLRPSASTSVGMIPLFNALALLAEVATVDEQGSGGVGGGAAAASGSHGDSDVATSSSSLVAGAGGGSTNAASLRRLADAISACAKASASFLATTAPADAVAVSAALGDVGALAFVLTVSLGLSSRFDGVIDAVQTLLPLLLTRLMQSEADAEAKGSKQRGTSSAAAAAGAVSASSASAASSSSVANFGDFLRFSVSTVSIFLATTRVRRDLLRTISDSEEASSASASASSSSASASSPSGALHPLFLRLSSSCARNRSAAFATISALDVVVPSTPWAPPASGAASNLNVHLGQLADAAGQLVNFCVARTAQRFPERLPPSHSSAAVSTQQTTRPLIAPTATVGAVVALLQLQDVLSLCFGYAANVGTQLCAPPVAAAASASASVAAPSAQHLREQLRYFPPGPIADSVHRLLAAVAGDARRLWQSSHFRAVAEVTSGLSVLHSAPITLAALGFAVSAVAASEPAPGSSSTPSSPPNFHDAAHLLCEMLRAASSYGETTPVVARLRGLVERSLRSNAASSLFPPEVLDFAIAVSWNRGVAAQRLGLLDVADALLGWSVFMLPLLEALHQKRRQLSGSSSEGEAASSTSAQQGLMRKAYADFALSHRGEGSRAASMASASAGGGGGAGGSSALLAPARAQASTAPSALRVAQAPSKASVPHPVEGGVHLDEDNAMVAAQSPPPSSASRAASLRDDAAPDDTAAAAAGPVAAAAVAAAAPIAASGGGGRRARGGKNIVVDDDDGDEVAVEEMRGQPPHEP